MTTTDFKVTYQIIGASFSKRFYTLEQAAVCMQALDARVLYTETLPDSFAFRLKFPPQALRDDIGGAYGGRDVKRVPKSFTIIPLEGTSITIQDTAGGMLHEIFDYLVPRINPITRDGVPILPVSKLT